MKYIQSFYQYPVTFSSIAKTIPARNAAGDMRNLCEVTEAQLDNLQRKEPFFRELVSKKKIRVLDHMPESYKTSAARINEANDEIARLKAENEKLRAKAEAPEKEPAPAEEEDAEEEDDGLEGERGRDAVAGVDEASAEEVGKREKAYEDMTYPELQDACKYAGIEYKNKKKAELIEALIAFDNR